MAYPHGKLEYIIHGTGAVGRTHNQININTTNSGEWAGPGYTPFLIRAVSVQPTTSVAASGAVISFRDVPDYATAQATGHEFTSVTLPCGATTLVYYRDDFTPRVISPGARVAVVPTNAATGVLVICRIYGEWAWDTPANATGRLATG